MNRRCHGSPLKYKSITTVEWQGKQNLLSTAMVLLNRLLPAAEQKPLFHSHCWAEIVLNILELTSRNILVLCYGLLMVYTCLSFLV